MTRDGSLVLVVDDQEAGRFIKTTVLRGAGFRVIEASTGGQALDLARRQPVDVVVLDVNLPDIHGFEVCRQIKRDGAEARSVHVLQISNTAVTDSDRIRGLQEGADVYLTEPVHPQLLLATVDALMRTRQAELALAAAAESERQARREAEEANRAKDEFLAAVSHELRTPLNAMMGWIWQLQRGHLSDETRARAIESLARASRMQVRLIDDLLDVSRIARGRLQLEVTLVDLRAVVERAVEAVRDQAHDRQLALDFSATAATVAGDAARLEQVVANLLGNALKFTPAGGRISVSLAVEDDLAVVRVADTGRGIDPAFQPHVFEQFRQGDTGFNRRHGGLGLGLAIVRQLVELHDGTVSVFSAGRDRGSTFTVVLPLANAARRASSETAIDPPGLLLNGVKVLVVEDEADTRDLLAEMLASSGAQVTTASSAAAAIAALESERFDVLVSDIGLPEQDGLQLLRRVRSLGHPIAAVAVTAYSSPDDRRRTQEGGYLAHVAKPVTPAALVRAVADVLSRGRTA